MAAEPIPEAVEHSLADCGPTVAHVEALLRTERDAPWSAASLVARLVIMAPLAAVTR